MTVYRDIMPYFNMLLHVYGENQSIFMCFILVKWDAPKFCNCQFWITNFKILAKTLPYTKLRKFYTFLSSFRFPLLCSTDIVSSIYIWTYYTTIHNIYETFLNYEKHCTLKLEENDILTLPHLECTHMV